MSALTRNAIRQTFWRLLEQMPLDQITVKMIVDACGISRNTFYYHYEDIRALLRDVLEAEFHRIFEEAPPADRRRTQALQLLTLIHSNRKALRHVYHSLNRQQIQDCLKEATDALAQSAVDAAGGASLDPKMRRTIAAFYTSAFLGVCFQWLESGTDEPPEALLNRMPVFDGLLEQTVAKAVQGSRLPPPASQKTE